MTDFEDLELNKDVTSMDAEEAKQTLSEFMEAHQTNRTAYDELNSELDEVETEYTEKLEEREELIAEFKQDRAEEAADYVNIPADLVAERFEYSEIEQIIEEGAEFAEEEEGADEDEETESLTTFSDKPEKGQTEGGQSKYRGRAKEKLKGKGFTVSE